MLTAYVGGRFLNGYLARIVTKHRERTYVTKGEIFSSYTMRLVQGFRQCIRASFGPQMLYVVSRLHSATTSNIPLHRTTTVGNVQYHTVFDASVRFLEKKVIGKRTYPSMVFDVSVHRHFYVFTRQSIENTIPECLVPSELRYMQLPVFLTWRSVSPNFETWDMVAKRSHMLSLERTAL